MNPLIVVSNNNMIPLFLLCWMGVIGSMTTKNLYCQGFSVVSSITKNKIIHYRHHSTSSCSSLNAVRNSKRSGSRTTSSDQQQQQQGRRKKDNNKKVLTIKELREQIQKNPDLYLNDNAGKAKKAKRTRKRVSNPKQKYVYAHQKGKQQQQQQKEFKKNHNDREVNDNDDDESNNNVPDALMSLYENNNNPNSPINRAKQYGLTNLASQHCDPIVDEVEPQIMGQIRVGEGDDSGSFAYVIYKPSGWSILGTGSSTANKSKAASAVSNNSDSNEKGSRKKDASGNSSNKKNHIKQMVIEEDDGTVDVLEYNELDIMALLTPEELEEYKLEEGLTGAAVSRPNISGKGTGGNEKKNNVNNHMKKIEVVDDKDGSVDTLEYSELDVMALLTPEELEEYKLEHGMIDGTGGTSSSSVEEGTKRENEDDGGVVSNNNQQPKMEQQLDARTEAVYSKIESRISKKKQQLDAFASYVRPSIIPWLKQYKLEVEDKTIRGGKFWTAIAGATNVDDTGLVVLCPKDKVSNLFIDYTEFIAVVGNGKYLTPKKELRNKKGGGVILTKESMKVDILSKIKKGRENDIVHTVSVIIPEQFTTCNDIVQPLQVQFQDGVRGDPISNNPFDKRSTRRLMHCNAMSVSSLLYDENVEIETPTYPDDIAMLSNRRNQHNYIHRGSFLGREALRNNELTTAYREINGAADGFPGWIVDRYDKWLLIHHDTKYPKGPVPSIHDGNTAGIYYLQHNQDRGAMGVAGGGVNDNIEETHGAALRPVLLEGQRAPEFIEILENGIKYLVSLEKDLSTGIFLDQRLQRGWLLNNCNENTSILNCFAHCGGYSIAAAGGSGASTVNIDLNSYWLDRIPKQLKLNGISDDEIKDKHDFIYGDCFDWIAKLNKRGEKYDIVILDPPSSSFVGGKKNTKKRGASGGGKRKRWSVKNDMADLVTLASQMVNTQNSKKSGLLWTSTNCESLSPISFANMCCKGFEQAGFTVGTNVKLERIVPMPMDYPCIGSQNVKNFVWRIFSS